MSSPLSTDNGSFGGLMWQEGLNALDGNSDALWSVPDLVNRLHRRFLDQEQRQQAPRGVRILGPERTVGHGAGIGVEKAAAHIVAPQQHGLQQLVASIRLDRRRMIERSPGGIVEGAQYASNVANDRML